MREYMYVVSSIMRVGGKLYHSSMLEVTRAAALRVQGRPHPSARVVMHLQHRELCILLACSEQESAHVDIYSSLIHRPTLLALYGAHLRHHHTVASI